MSNYTLFNPTMPSTHLKSMVTWNGGGGGEGGAPSSSPRPQARPADLDTSPERSAAGKATLAAAQAQDAAQAQASAKAQAASQAQAAAEAQVQAQAQAAAEVQVQAQAQAAAEAQVQAQAQAAAAEAKAVEDARVAAEAKAVEDARVAAEAQAAADAQAAVDAEAARVAAAQGQSQAIAGAAGNMQQGSVEDPASLVTTANVGQIDPNAAGTNVATGTGSIDSPAPQITDPNAFNAGSVDATTASGQVASATDGITAAQGSVSPTALVDAAQGSLSPEAMATAAGFDTQYLQEVQAGTRTVTPQELSKFATANNIPSAEAAQMLSQYQGVSAATFDGDTPEAEAQDTYTLTPTQVAQQQATTVQDAATASEYPTAAAAQSDWQSTIEAAQGSVGANELVNANDIVGAATAVTAVAATMEALDVNSVAAAAQGSFSQSALAQAA